jgi:Kef-type K+ transport system membrane component KefB
MHVEVLPYLLLDLAIIILAARAFGWLARRLGQPAVIGEIAAGILLGPTILGRFFPGLPNQIFPAAVPLKQFADVGLVFFMFLVGLELDTKLMRREGRRALQISLSGVLLPLALGMLIALPLVGVNNGGVFSPQEGATSPPPTLNFALFLGAAMCITAFPILARILVETGLYKAPVGAAALCAAAVDDAIAWILLAGVVGLTRNGSAAAALPAFLLTFLFVGLMFTAGRRALERLARQYDKTNRLSVDQVALVVAGLLLSAFITERIGIHAIFGAFIFGTIMPERAGMTHALTDKIEDFTLIVLLPVFFTVTGLRTDLFTLNSVALLGWTMAIVIVATAGKFIGCALAARLTGSTGREATIVGALMNTRGLTELVILSIGRDLGVLSDRTFAMMVIMALATTVIAAPIVNRLISRDELVGQLVGTAPDHDGLPAGSAPRRILVALGNPQNAPRIVDAALRLLGTARPAELLLIRLIPTPRAPEFRTGLLEVESQVAAAVESMRPLVAQAAAAGVVARPISFLTDDVGADLARIAADQGCAAMILGWHRASLAHAVIQALVRRVFALAPCDVAVFVDRAGGGLATGGEGAGPVLVPLTGGAHDEAALTLATELARGLDTSLKLVGYVGRQPGQRVTAASERLARRADALREASGRWVAPVFAAGDATPTALEEATGATVAIVPVGENWRDAEDFGSPAADLAERLACPTLVVRGAAGATAATATPAKAATTA